MENTRLIGLLRTFSKQEINEFGDFVNSPFHNKRTMVSKFYEQIREYYPGFNDPLMTKENIFKKMYCKEKYNDDLTRNLISHLFKLAEEFLAYKAISEDTFIKKKYLLRELTEREQFRIFEKQLKITRELLKKDDMSLTKDFLDQYSLELEVVKFLNRSHSSPFLVNDNAQKIADNLLKFFLMACMANYSYMINQSKNAFDYDFKMPFLEIILDHVKENNYESIPYILLQFNSINLLQNGEKKYFYELKNILIRFRNKLTKVDVFNSYVFLYNYCYRQNINGNEKFAREGFEVYKDAFTNEAYKPDGYLHHIFFKNAVTCALTIDEFEWTEDFIKKYYVELLEDQKDSSYNLCFAFLCFHKEKYDEALNYLSKITLEDITYKADVKVLTAMIFFELDSKESLLSHLDSYKHFLNSNKLIPARLKETHSGFVKYLSLLLKTIEKKKKQGIRFLIMEIKKSDYFVYKKWLLKKAEDKA